MLKNVRYYKTKITKYVHKVCFISIQNTVNEKFLAKHFLQHQFFLNIISTFTLATLSLPVLHLRQMFPSYKNQYTGFSEKINGMVFV